MMPDRKLRKILFVHLGALGDFLLALPVIAAYRKPGGETEIDICASAGIRQLALGWGIFTGEIDPERNDFHRLFLPEVSLPGDQAGIFSRYDLVITTSANPELTANLRSLVSRVLCPEKPGSSPSRHLQDVYLDCLLLPGLRAERKMVEPTLLPPETWTSRGREILKPQKPGRTLIIHPGSGGKIKCWPLSSYLELAERASRIGLFPCFLLGPAEKERPEIADLKNSTRFPVLSDLSLVDTAAVLAQAGIYVGNDSGATHLAAVLGIPVVAIFGPSDPERFGPRGSSVRIMYLDYECSPCHPRDREGSLSECGINRACLGEIKPEMVAREIEKLRIVECGMRNI
jgi:ADP-heptose:LPS heptosyltransferase